MGLLESANMMTPPADLGYIERELRDAADALLEAYEDANEPPPIRSATPDLLMDSAERLLTVLRDFEQEPGDFERESEDANDIHALGDYGIRVLSDLIAWVRYFHLAEAQSKLQGSVFALAAWVVRHGGELSHLEPVVDAAAHVANNIKAPGELERTFLAVSDIMEAVSPTLSEDIDRSNPGRPWRLLLLNRAIVATRSHQPALMEQAFKTLTELLPEDAADFFNEGMEQMDALGYPIQVREVMQKYYQLWCKPRTLH